MWTVFESVGKLLAHGELGLGTLKLHSGQRSVVQSLGGGLFVFFFSHMPRLLESADLIKPSSRGPC